MIVHYVFMLSLFVLGTECVCNSDSLKGTIGTECVCDSDGLKGTIDTNSAKVFSIAIFVIYAIAFSYRVSYSLIYGITNPGIKVNYRDICSKMGNTDDVLGSTNEHYSTSGIGTVNTVMLSSAFSICGIMNVQFITMIIILRGMYGPDNTAVIGRVHVVLSCFITMMMICDIIIQNGVNNLHKKALLIEAIAKAKAEELQTIGPRNREIHDGRNLRYIIEHIISGEDDIVEALRVMSRSYTAEGISGQVLVRSAKRAINVKQQAASITNGILMSSSVTTVTTSTVIVYTFLAIPWSYADCSMTENLVTGLIALQMGVIASISVWVCSKFFVYVLNNLVVMHAQNIDADLSHRFNMLIKNEAHTEFIAYPTLNELVNTMFSKLNPYLP